MSQRHRLPNGLTVVFHPQRTAPVAAFQVWVKAGSADEQEDQVGLAHLHEHMLFKGTALRAPGQIAREIEAHGGEVNAWTSFDQTVYHAVLASRFAEVGLSVLADAVQHSAFDAGELSREIEVVCEEIKRSDDSPARRASRDLFATAFRVHPYRRPVIGWEHTVRSFSRTQVLEFYRQHYSPRNMVLVAAGDLDEGRVLRWVEREFGGAGDGAWAPSPPRPAEPLLEGRRVLLKEDEAKEAHLNLAFPAPDVSHPDAPALDVLAMLLGQSESARLVLELKRKRALVNEVSAYAYTPKDPGLLGVAMTLPQDRLEAALGELGRALGQVRDEPVSLDELRVAQRLIEAEAVYHRETVEGLARKLGYFEAAVGGIEREAEYYERVLSLEPSDVQRVAAKYLCFDRLVLTALLPKGATLLPERAEEALSARRERSPVDSAAKKRQAREDRPRPPFGPARQVDSRVVVEKLSSGATVLVRPESAVPLVAVRAAFLGGLRYESPGDNGVSALVSRMLTRGTPELSAEEVSQTIDELSGSLAGNSGRNSMGLRGEFLSRHFERAFRLFSDCLLRPAFAEAELERERELVLQEIFAREDRPSGVAFDLFAKTLFESHPYRLQALGEKESVEKLSREGLLAFHARHLAPSRLTLCVVGDVRVDEVLALAEEAFGRAPALPAEPFRVEDEPAPKTRRSAKRSLAREQSHLVIGFRGARVFDPWRYPLEVLSAVLSGQGGRLFVELRDRRSMAYSVSSFSIEGIDPGYFAVYMGTSPEKVAEATEGIRRELVRVCEEPVSNEELLRAKQHLLGTHEIGLQRNGARAGLLALDFCYGLGVDALSRYGEEVDKVTAEDVLEVARRVVTLGREVEVVVGP